MSENNYIKNELQHISDLNSKDIFADPVLMAQFLRDFVNVEAFRDVKPSDIEDISERYRPFLGAEFEADTVKSIRLSRESCQRLFAGIEESADKELSENGTEIYIISLIEHKSRVDYDITMQLLKYISAIWTKYAKDHAAQSKNKSFRYPPVIPIVYYEGVSGWYAAREVKERVVLGNVFEPYIPNFRYLFVNIHDYENEELLSKEDEMSFIMLLNKIQTSQGIQEFFRLPQEDMDRILKKAPEKLLNLIGNAVWGLCKKMNVPEEESIEFVGRIKEMRQMGYLFENMEKIDIQAEREKVRKEREEAKRQREMAEKYRQDAERYKKDAEKYKEETEKYKEEIKTHKKEAEMQTEKAQLHAIQLGIQLCKIRGNSREETLDYLSEEFQLTRVQAEMYLEENKN